jgi:hypothetical protein
LLSVRPTIVTIAHLATHPRDIDGKLVSFRAHLELGWEGDNFLWDAPKVVASGASGELPRLWFHVDSARERQVFGALGGNRSVVGTFTGFFHFVPDRKARTNGMFDPGPLQFSAVSISDVKVSGS